MQHTTETLPEAPGAGYYMNFFLTKPLLSEAGNIAGFSNSEKKTEA